MAVLRDTLFYAQQRLDVPVLRQIESGVVGDMDLLAGRILAGKKPLIVNGFNIVVNATIINNSATNLVLNVAGSQLIHYLASENGSIFFVPADRTAETLNTTNSRIVGSWSANTTNYIGIDLIKQADDATSDVVQFIDPLTDLETPKIVPLARTLDYKIYIQNVPFSSTVNIAPVAIVITDANNNVTSIEDARQLMFRLGSGGDSPNSVSKFNWATRSENPIITTTGAADPFASGDKQLASLKDWIDAVNTRLWEVGGGEHWFSQTSDKNVRMAFAPPTVPMQDNFAFDGTHVTWSGITLIFNNSTTRTNSVTDNTGPGLAISSGQVLYVDVDRTQLAALTAVVGDNIALGDGTIPGSRFVLAWCSGPRLYIRNKEYWVGKIGAGATTTLLGNIRTIVDNAGVPGLGTTVVLNNGTVIDPVAPLVDITNGSATPYSIIGAGITRGTGLYGLPIGNITIGGNNHDNSISLIGGSPSATGNTILIQANGQGNAAPAISISSPTTTDNDGILIQGGQFNGTTAGGESVKIVAGFAGSAAHTSRSLYIKGSDTSGASGVESVRIEGGNPTGNPSAASIRFASFTAAANTGADYIMKAETAARVGNVLEVQNSASNAILSVSDGSNTGTVFGLNTTSGFLASVSNTGVMAIRGTSGQYTYNSSKSRTIVVPAQSFILGPTGNAAPGNDTTNVLYWWTQSAAGSAFLISKAMVPPGAILSQAILYYNNNTGGNYAANNITIDVAYFTSTSLATNTFSAKQSVSNAIIASGSGLVALSFGSSITTVDDGIFNGQFVNIQIKLNAGAATDFRVFGVGLQYSQTTVNVMM